MAFVLLCVTLKQHLSVPKKTFAIRIGLMNKAFRMQFPLLLFIVFASIVWCDLVSSKDAPAIQKLPASLNILAGQKLKVSCALLSGSHPVEFNWYKNDQELDSKRNVDIQKPLEDTSTLVISPVDSNDAGHYKCFAKNTVGTDSADFEVYVKGNHLLNAN